MTVVEESDDLEDGSVHMVGMGDYDPGQRIWPLQGMTRTIQGGRLSIAATRLER